MVGDGAMGRVYEAHPVDGLVKRPVAMKVMKLALDEADTGNVDPSVFRHEMLTGAEMEHDNIVTVRDAGIESGFAYIIMDLIRGKSLKDMLKEEGPFAPDRAQSIMQGVLAGLQYCHNKGVVHCDIKPANIMVTADGKAMITDFGVALAKRSEIDPQILQGAGSPAYQAPEQFGKVQPTARTDIYAAGVLLFELLTGERAFKGDMVAVRAEILSGRFPSFPNAPTVSADLQRVLRKAIARNPDDRFYSAREFASALEQATTDGTRMPPRLRRVTPAAPLEQPATRSRIPVILAGGTGSLLLAGLLAWLLWPAHRPPLKPPAPAYTMLPSAPAPEATPSPPPPQPVQPPEAALPDQGRPAVPGPVSPAPAMDPERTVTAPSPAVPVPPPVPKPRPLAETVPAAVEAVACSVLLSRLGTDGGITVSGVGEQQSIAQLKVNLDGLGRTAGNDAPGTVAEVKYVQPALCPVLDLVKAAYANGAARLQLLPPGRMPVMRGGEYITPRVEAPDFNASIVGDYFSLGDDGSPAVAHLTLLPSGTQAPGRGSRPAVVTLGIDRPRELQLIVSKPFGTDLVLAIASSEPLSLGKRTTEAVPAGREVEQLRSAIFTVLRKGGRVALGVLAITTVER